MLHVEHSSPRSSRPVWVLLGKHHGDNQQLIALAESLERPVLTIQLHYGKLISRLPAVLLGRRLLPLSEPVAWPSPWPEIVLASGRRVVPVVRWIQARAARSGIATHLIHLGRPRAPLRWFDLIVTTAQYGLPDRDNVIRNLLPLRNEPAPGSAPPDSSSLAAFSRLPRPWTVALVGGNSRPYCFDREAAQRLALEIDGQVRANGGSAIILGAPRTVPERLDEIERGLQVEHVIWRWSARDNPYRALLRQGDRFIVTSDSLAMLGDALSSGRPVQLFELPQRLDIAARIAIFAKRAGTRSPWLHAVHAWLIDAGLIFSLRDLAECHRQLREAGVFGQPDRALSFVAQQRERTVARARALVDRADPAGEIAAAPGGDDSTSN
ncbi:ELM1/GtrOC1 family putative glycosyltransferase [Solimonas terrae]|uniref:Nucleoside-diphosphate sugar epimerase n=1 Tax=Solimonas terrae TaxID=1396819 RepID=A0A6M2BNJ1_9GAMM|nr:ELM1/GtrOC1 family putative glycosyltransferase [Solimonas terrae]NGY03629.1 hypothetical protein [Solimonas terrae]